MKKENVVLAKKSKWYFELNGVKYVDISSRSTKILKDMAPDQLGPCVASDGIEFQNLENLWQYSKVFEGVQRVDKEKYFFYVKNGVPTQEYYDFRNEGAALESADKKLAGVISKNSYKFFFKEGDEVKLLDEIEARKKIYIPGYAKLVVKTEGFKKLKKLVDDGQQVVLYGEGIFDYTDKDVLRNLYSELQKKYDNLYFDDVEVLESVKDLINFPYYPLGYGVILKALLEEDLEIVDGKIVDHAGLLD